MDLMNGTPFVLWMIAAIMMGLTLILGTAIGLTECDSKDEVRRWAAWMVIALLFEATYPISFPILIVSATIRWYRKLPEKIDPKDKRHYSSTWGPF